MIKQKKGMEGGMMLLVVSGVLALIIFVFYIVTGGKFFGAFGEATDKPIIEQKLKFCEQKKDNPLYSGYSNMDNDQYLDFCDNCPLVPNNDLAKYPDNDGDLFPKGCCGNDGSNYINKKSPKDIGYCSDKDEETADADRDPRKHPAYSYKKS
ncbi:hypothetical protein J4209_05800 [Candidatus Woesearchaeota archaeon]|nr:hypothetical protein [Candidatus Woesearchaeota archaeon]